MPPRWLFSVGSASPVRIRWKNASPLFNALLNVIGALASSELDHPEVSQPLFAERILRRYPFDLLTALPDCQDDPAIPRNLSARHDEMARRVVLAQERHVRLHLRVDLLEGGFVGKFDDKHVLSRFAGSRVRGWNCRGGSLDPPAAAVGRV